MKLKYRRPHLPVISTHGSIDAFVIIRIRTSTDHLKQTIEIGGVDKLGKIDPPKPIVEI